MSPALTLSFPTKTDIIEAHDRIRPFVHRTPVLNSQSINEITGIDFFFKCENLQKIGAFKIRGATNAILSMPPEKRAKGIATHSSGNHAQAVALGAKLNGVKAWIVMPETSPKVKLNAVKGYGAEVIMCAPTQQARESTLEQVIEKTGAEFVHPYDDWQVVTGQATAAKELIEDTPNLDVIIAPVGGGGLISGTALSVHYFSPEIEVFAGEPEGANDAFKSFAAGQIIPNQGTNTIADGLLTTIGPKTLAILQKHVKEVITVSEAEIIASMRLIWERMKIIVEPSAAVPFAAAIKHKAYFAGKKVGVILTGGNVDLKKVLSYLD